MCTAVFWCFLTTGVLEQLEVLLKDEDATVRKQTCELLHLICGHNIGRYYNTAILGCSTRQVLWLRRGFFFRDVFSTINETNIFFFFFNFIRINRVTSRGQYTACITSIGITPTMIFRF